MSNKCDITGVGVLSGNNVSHSMRKTRRKFNPNIRSLRLMSDVLGQKVRLKVAACTLRSVEKAGGLDKLITSLPESSMSSSAKKLRKTISLKLEASQAAGQ